jgi:16S rRNA (guanine527-N7)-methyltransferase
VTANETEGHQAVPPVAETVFGPGLDGAIRFADLLARHGVERGLIGPRELDRLWERHLLNSAVIGERIPQGARVVDIGSGAGFPGIPLALARPDLKLVLVEPMARRVDWLQEAIAELDLPVDVVRGRAEERAVRDQVGGADVVTSRAVAPLARLVRWSLPLLRPGGTMVALKGASVREEIERDSAAVTRAGGGSPTVAECGSGVLEMPTTVVTVERVPSTKPVRRGRAVSGKQRRAR